MIKIDFGMIIFNGDYVLRENLDSIYPFANRIIIVEGPVKYYRNLGFRSSADNTVNVIKNFPDPEKKVVFIQGEWEEKDEMIRQFEPHFAGDYLWHVDSDELYKREDMEKVIAYLDANQNTCYSMAFRLYSFYGGLERFISGHEQDFEVIRIQKIIPSQSKWKTHRPPTMFWPPTGRTCKEMGHINQFQSEQMFGIRIFHYPYVFPSQVKMKIAYYQTWSSIIPNYWSNLYIPWMRAKTEEDKLRVEAPFLGVNEWLPVRRGPAFTQRFDGTHPEGIERIKDQINDRIAREAKSLGVLS